MTAPIVQCKPDRAYNLWLRFADGLEGSVNMTNLTCLDAFSSWRDTRTFLTARPDSETGDLLWPTCGIRLAYEILYESIAAEGGKYGPPPADPRTTIEPGFYRFMASALVPVRLAAPRRKRPPKEAE